MRISDQLCYNSTAIAYIVVLMPGIVRLEPSDQEFRVDGNDSILDAALQAGVPLNYGCSNGNCGLCRARLVSGEVRKISHHDFVLGEAEKSMGHVLLCSYTADGDVVIEVADSAVIPEQTINARVKKLTPLTSDVVLLHLQTPRTQRLRFLAGQSVRLELDNQVSATHPVASCPCDDRNIQFHIRVIADDAFSRQVTTLKPTGAVQITGPFGEFTLNDDSRRSIFFLAFNTGFAPIKSLIEHAMQLEQSEHLQLYWIVESEGAHYMHNLVRSWLDVFDSFSYTPLTAADLCPQVNVAAGLQDDAWQDVSRALLRQISTKHENVNDCDFYVAGPDAVAGAARDFLASNNFPTEQFKSLSIT